MATTVSRSNLTLVDMAKQTDPDGNLATITEVLEESNPILEDMQMEEANGSTYHKITQRLSLPTGTWRQLNAGVSPEVSNTVPLTEGLGMLEAYSEADKELVNMSPNPTMFRNQEAKSFIEGMGQNLAETLLYGSASLTPAEFDGLATRMATLDPNGVVLDGGGTGSDLTSIYVVQWGMGQVMGLFPKGSSGNVGVTHTDLGEETKIDSSGNMWQVYRDHFKLKSGLAVYRSDCIGRYANIEGSSPNNFNEDILIRLINRMYQKGRGATIYVSTELLTQMEIKLKDKSNVNYTSAKGNGLSGDEVLMFKGKPVKAVDQILDTEDAIT